ncbi:hypothetical protein GOBAR_AA09743 [Gossypium barbadense]|uniref:Uncharacterized protein n=1 Tax=Gossypium barbadense TaxID=3634 RepID=A0A2P5Y5N0_GOSBA|nr:hypothetical protein GOBAR_AA09743 [Gossypium barbadense]
MLTKFISVSETHFQIIETTFKNQQASIQALETQIGQLAKLISEQPQPRQGIVVSKSKGEVDHSEQTLVSKEYKPCVPYPNAARKDCTDEQFGMRSVNSSHDHDHATERFPRTTWPSTRACLRPCPCNGRQHGRVKIGQNVSLTRESIRCHGHATWPWISCHIPYSHMHSLDTMSNPHGMKTTIPTSKKLKGAASSLGPTVEIQHPFLHFPQGPQEELLQILRARAQGVGRCIDWAVLEQIQLADVVRALLTINPWGLFFEIIEPTYLELTLEPYSTFHLQVVMTEFNDLKMVQFRLNCLVRQLTVSEFGVTLRALVPASATYDRSRSKASAFAPSLRYLHAILAHTLTGRQESTGIINILDAYFLWSMVNGHVFDLAYFIALAIRNQTERHRKGVISIGPYMTHLAGWSGMGRESYPLALI